MVRAIDGMLLEDDELNSCQLREQLLQKFPLLECMLATIKHIRKRIGWVLTRPHYCQLIREANKLKQLEWCKNKINKEQRRVQ